MCSFCVLRLHEFVWHGTDPENKTRLVPGLLRFTQLTIIPDHFYYNVSLTLPSLTTSVTTWVSHYHPWPLLLQRESHTIIPDHFCYNVSLTFHITDCHTWPLLLQCESHISHNTSLTFTQFTIIPDCFCYNVSQPFTQLDVIHVRFCYNMSLTFHTTDESRIHTTRCHTWPLLLQREFHISHNSLSYLTTSVTS